MAKHSKKKKIITVAMLFMLFVYVFISWRLISSFESESRQDEFRKLIREGVPTAEDIDSFRSNEWPKLQKALCGKGHPDPKRLNDLSILFFNLARMEVVHDETILRQDKIANLFYNQDAWGTFVYYDDHASSDANPSFQSVYMRAWKCGNNQIFTMTRQMFVESKRYNGTFQVLTLEGTDTALKKVGLLGKATSPMISPCIYTTVRDPILHFLSGYNEVEFRTLEKEQPFFEHVAPYHKDVPLICF